MPLRLISNGVDFSFICVIIKRTLIKGLLRNEKKSQNSVKHCKQAQSRVSQQNGYKIRQKSFISSTAKREKKTLYLKLQSLTIALLDIYQKYISIILPSSCRFWPNCSQYSKQAILKYGLCKGGLKAIVRVLRCHPLSGKSGYDPLL